MVLKGDYSTTPEMLPIIIPELQNRSVISVVSSSTHFCALTSSRELLTWDTRDEEGQGQVEQPSRVTVPSEVRLEHGLKAEGIVERYYFAAAVGGNYTAALVVDLAGDEAPPEETVPLKKSNTDHSP